MFIFIYVFIDIFALTSVAVNSVIKRYDYGINFGEGNAIFYILWCFLHLSQLQNDWWDQNSIACKIGNMNEMYAFLKFLSSK